MNLRSQQLKCCRYRLGGRGILPDRLHGSIRNCTARTSAANEDGTVDNWAESELAWELADAINHLLADRDRSQLYVTIGSGDSYGAIETALQTMAHHDLSVPAELIAKLANWLDAYAHSRDVLRLHELLRALIVAR